MREKHELERGIICEKCLKTSFKKEYTRISFTKPIPEDTTGRTRVVSRMNLCNKCYEELKLILETFVGKSFVEKVDVNKEKEELKKIRKEIMETKNNHPKEKIK